MERNYEETQTVWSLSCHKPHEADDFGTPQTWNTVANVPKKANMNDDILQN